MPDPETFPQWRDRYWNALAAIHRGPDPMPTLGGSVLVALRTYQPPPDGLASPTNDALARVVGCSNRSVRRALAGLRTAGHVS